MPRNFIGHQSFKGRGSLSNVAGRFDSLTLEKTHDGWYQDEIVEHLSETVLPDRARSVITSNDSPDVGFEVSINPYRGCSHGCVYCFARPTHAYLGLSPGLDFETKLFYKADAVSILEVGTRKTEICLQDHRARNQYGRLSAAGKAAGGHARHSRGAGPLPASRHHRHQERADRSRSGFAGRSRQGQAGLGDGEHYLADRTTSSARWSRGPRLRRRGCASSSS